MAAKRLVTDLWAVLEANCALCLDSGRCPDCDGTGYEEVIGVLDCPVCQGSGRCPECRR